MNATQSIYAQRRARLASMLGAGGIAIIPTAPERPRNRDTDFIYRHDSYFYYLTGFAEPGAVLVQVIRLVVELVQFQSAAESGSTGMSPVGMMSKTVKGEVVGPLPPFVTVMV